MEFGVLGPLLVRTSHGDVHVPGPRQRALLGMLLLRANQTVSNDVLVEAVWDGRSLPGAMDSLPSYVMRLRRALGPEVGGRVVTRPGGYAIEVADSELDLSRFKTVWAKAREFAEASDWEAASDSLTAALALWRGEPLADVPVQNVLHEELRGLSELRLQAVQQRAEAYLELGRHREIIPELQRAIAAHPLHEPVRGQLMTALYRSGRQAEALEAYRDARRMLADELGVEPTPALQDLHERILHADPALARSTAQTVEHPVPRQLPAAIRHFAGRAEQIKALTQLVGDAGRPSGTVVISAINGTAGIGKTALAVYWAHQMVDWFPDGQLYVNLRGFDPAGAPMPPAEAIRGFLDALGVPPQRIPTGLDEQAALYRSQLADRRMLVLLDNARDAEQVRPLLPGSPGCLVVITSRDQLAGLVAGQGASPLTLGLLSPDEARDLISRRLGSAVVSDQRAAVDELIELCARLPLALNIAAARAALNTARPLADLVAQLRDTPRLDALRVGDRATDVRAVFSWSYRRLGAPAARMFRLLGVHSGPDISLAAAAGLAGIPRDGARDALDELTQAHLIAECGGGRYSFHDLLRAYAVEQAAAHDSEDERREAVHRMLDHYLLTAHAATLRVDQTREPITPPAPAPGAAPEVPADDRQAWRWFEAERAVLLAAVGRAADEGFDTHAWQLAWALVPFFTRQGHPHDHVATQTVAVTAAERSCGPLAQAVAHRGLGLAHARLAAYGRAYDHLRRSLELYRELGDTVGQARSHNSLAWTLEKHDRHAEAIDHARRALDLYRAAGNRIGQAAALNAIGWSESQLGRHEQALIHCQEALDLHRDLEAHDDEAGTLDSMGYAYHHLGRYPQARASFREAVDLFRDLGDRQNQAIVLDHLADTHLAMEDRDAAREAWGQALCILTAMEHSDGDTGRIRAKLARLTTA